MKCSDRKFLHNNVLSLPFRKVLSIKSDKIDELSEESYVEVLDKEFIVIFALSGQDLEVIKVVAELNIEKKECQTH